PAPIVTRLNEAIVQAMHASEVKEQVLKTGAVPAGDSAAAFEAFMARERARLAEVIVRRGIVLAD
ncbi:MAG TPA: tripartite tricarboxylate transporter substrate binding protein, partial [Burkholderiales bacterium]